MKIVASLLGIVAVLAVVGWFLRTRTSPSPVSDGASQAFVLSQEDWIRVQSGLPESVQSAITSYGEVLAGEDSQDFPVVLSRHRDGYLVLTFPEKLPAYPFVNLIGWLGAPPGIEGVSGTTGWFTSPATGIRYVLEPDNSNPLGDTLVGYSSTGESVEVYQPDIGLCLSAPKSRLEPEPRLGQLEEISRTKIRVPLEVRKSFGNPQFVITHPPNTQWH